MGALQRTGSCWHSVLPTRARCCPHKHTHSSKTHCQNTPQATRGAPEGALVKTEQPQVDLRAVLVCAQTASICRWMNRPPVASACRPSCSHAPRALLHALGSHHCPRRVPPPCLEKGWRAHAADAPTPRPQPAKQQHSRLRVWRHGAHARTRGVSAGAGAGVRWRAAEGAAAVAAAPRAA
jgi:hypothetical protein